MTTRYQIHRSVRLLPDPIQEDDDVIEGHRISFISSCLKMSSFLLITPFKVWNDAGSDSLILIERKRLMKGICLLTQLSQLIFLYQAMKDALEKMQRQVEAWAVLIFITHIFEGILLLLTFYTFWASKKELELLLKKLEDWKKNKGSLTQKELPKWPYKLMKGPEAVLAWAYMAFLIRGVNSSYERSAFWTMASSITAFIPFEEIRYVVSFPVSIILFLLDKTSCITELHIVSGALSMYEVGKEFQGQVRAASTPVELMEAHKKIRSIFNRFNDIYGHLFLSHYVFTLLSYVTLPAMLTKMTFSLDKLIERLVFIGVNVVTYWSSCEVHSMIKDSVMDWMHEGKLRKEVMPTDLIKLGILASEMESQPVGISCNFFIITYGLMGSFLGLLATYAIFAWQMQAHGLK